MHLVESAGANLMSYRVEQFIHGGGLFYMLNNTICQAGLFLSTGSVEMWARTDDVDGLGGLAGRMPITFVSFLVAAMAVAGVPPLNGSVSSWMVYRGIVGLMWEGNKFYALFLIAVMLGSALTLASFLTLLHSVFLGRRPAALARTREAGFAMWLPSVVLAFFCVLFGVFACQMPLRGLIYPSLPLFVRPVGIWQTVLTTLLVLAALGVGLLMYLRGTDGRRTSVGGETTGDKQEGQVAVSAFYASAKQVPILNELLKCGDRGTFDIYNWLTRLVRALVRVFR